MEPAKFLEDLTGIPERLGFLADQLERGLPGLDKVSLTADGRILILGMGSSAYASDVIARDARATGLNVVVELASSRTLPPPSPDLTVIAISATGASVEVLAAIEPYVGHGRLIAVTNRPDSALAQAADAVVGLHAGVEASGVACRTFRHTLLVSDALLDASVDGNIARVAAARQAAESTQVLLDTRSDWVADIADTLGGPDGTWALAPVERLSSAKQSALMMREIPRRTAYASETGDWSHVDVYLTKAQDYRALVFAGSAWDAPALGWMHERGSTLVSVGAMLKGATHVIRYPGDTDENVARLAEVIVGELVAEHWWRAMQG